MKLHFLGTTGYHPNNRRQTACMMLPELGVIFDAGTGLYRARDLIQTKTLDIFLSHIHLDHSIGLTFLYDILYEKQVERVTVHVAEEKIDVIKNHLYHPMLFPVQPNFEFQPLADEPLKLGEATTISAFELGNHPGGSHGFRLEHEGASLAYITDTVAVKDSAYIQDIKDVDVLIHECYFPDGWEDRAKLTGHSCLSPVAKIAADAKVGELYLVHINPLDESAKLLDLEKAKSTFKNLSVAEDELVIDISK